MEYYYTKSKNVDLINNSLVIDDYELKHLVRVLRKKAGDKITVTDGERNIFHCKIETVDRDKMRCRITGKEFNLSEPEINLSLFLSPLRNAARFEFAVEKAVELGVSSLHPVITDFTVNKNVFSRSKIERMEKIIIGAMGQSQRCFLPGFHKPVTFDELLTQTEKNANKIVMYESSDDTDEIRLDESTNDITLLIGPEGGFSGKEVGLLSRNNWHVKSLGKRKLRAETAAIVSVFNLLSQNKSKTSASA